MRVNFNAKSNDLVWKVAKVIIEFRTEVLIGKNEVWGNKCC